MQNKTISQMLFWNFIVIALFSRVGPLLFDDIPEVKEYIPIHGSSISRVSMASSLGGAIATDSGPCAGIGRAEYFAKSGRK